MKGTPVYQTVTSRAPKMPEEWSPETANEKIWMDTRDRLNSRLGNFLRTIIGAWHPSMETKYTGDDQEAAQELENSKLYIQTSNFVEDQRALAIRLLNELQGEQ